MGDTFTIWLTFERQDIVYISTINTICSPKSIQTLPQSFPLLPLVEDSDKNTA